jgi:hypothetical protein
MAEITTASAEQKPGVGRSKKLSTRVDLTPMVDLGFLLITFFIFTTKMSESKRIQLHLPAGPVADTKVPESTALTAILLDNSRIFYYHGNLDDALKTNSFGMTGFSMQNGIGDIIRQKQAALDKTDVKREELMLIIKPTKDATYLNTVDILDEVLINDLRHYSFVDVEEAEMQVIAARYK